ncbi:MAG: NAD(P)H-dependent oxidoreductase [Candidatus Omnitrophota bacterium]
MKQAIIVLYSYSGNTKQLAEILIKQLENYYEVDVISVEALDEPDSFFKQAARALFRKKAQIKEENINFDLSGYDLVAFGTPVWAFGPAPAMRTYLTRCTGIRDKTVLFFATYGSGAGKDKCIEQMRSLLKKQAPGKTESLLVQQFELKNEDRIIKKVNEVVKILK